MGPIILGQALVAAIDVGNSMLVRDIKPNRIEAAKRFVSVALRNLSSKGMPLLVGLVAFHKRSVPMVDLTEDITVVDKALVRLRAHGRASDVSEALRESYYMLREAPPGYSRRVLLVTSGVVSTDMVDEIMYLYRITNIRIDIVVVSGNADSRAERFKSLAAASGGLVIPLNSIDEVGKGVLSLFMS